MTAAPHTAPARPVGEALAPKQMADAIQKRWDTLTGQEFGDGSTLGWRRTDLCHQFGLAVLKELDPLLAELASLREENERLREIVESDHNGKAIAEYEWERANKLAAENATLRAQRDEAVRDLRAAVIEIGEQARGRGEAEGKLRASEMAGIVDGWIDRAAAAEAAHAAEREARAVADMRCDQLAATIIAMQGANKNLRRDLRTLRDQMAELAAVLVEKELLDANP